MEHLLWLYARPYDAAEPVVCFDERPCFLIGDLVEPLALQSGQVRKEHYAYEKHGSCALLAAIEPLTGQRVGQIYPQRTKREYALFCQTLAAQYPNARTIHLVQDNLNTHHTSAFYQHLPADETFALAQRFTFHYTPKSASWLIHGRPYLPQASIDDGEKDKIAAIYMASSPVAKRFLPPTRLSTAYIHSAFGWRFDARPRWNLLDSPFNISTAFVWPDGCPGYAADGSTDLAIV